MADNGDTGPVRRPVFDRDMAGLAPAGVNSRAFASMPEAVRLATIKAAATPPPICGPEIPAAPARGAFRTFRPMEMVPGTAGAARPAGYRGPGEVVHRSALRRADVFDAMREGAWRRHEAAGGDAASFVPPFTPGQEQAGRSYRDMTERHEAAGIRCASLEAVRSGGSGGEFIDAFVAEGRRLDAMRDAIGFGNAMEARRQVGQDDPPLRGVIMTRALVDMVCLGDMRLSQVLAAHGWARRTASIAVLRQALSDALDRMQRCAP